MQLRLPDLFCPECRGYVHPFLDRCPGCGAERRSRFEEARFDDPREPSLTDDPEFVRAAGEARTKYAFASRRSGMLAPFGSEGGGEGTVGSPPGPDLEELVHSVASQLTYRGAGFADGRPIDVDVMAEQRLLTFRDHGRQRVGAFEPALVLAASPLRGAATKRAGIGFEGFSPLDVPPLDGNRLQIAWHAPEGHRCLVLANRSGFLRAHATSEYYMDLAKWIGAYAAATAQARWRAIGAEAYAAELGLRAAPAGAAESAPEESAGQQPRSVYERLEELERLRAAGLVTDTEYAAKRHDILGGL